MAQILKKQSEFAQSELNEEQRQVDYCKKEKKTFMTKEIEHMKTKWKVVINNRNSLVQRLQKNQQQKYFPKRGKNS